MSLTPSKKLKAGRDRKVYGTQEYIRPTQNNTPMELCDLSARSPRCRIMFGNYKLWAILDTGAQHTVIQENHYRRLPKECKLSMDVTARSDLRAANGAPIHMVGKARIKLKLGEQEFVQLFLVVKNLARPMLLGNDFLAAHKAEINYGQEKLIIDGTHFPLVSIEDPLCTIGERTPGQQKAHKGRKRRHARRGRRKDPRGNYIVETGPIQGGPVATGTEPVIPSRTVATQTEVEVECSRSEQQSVATQVDQLPSDHRSMGTQVEGDSRCLEGLLTHGVDTEPQADSGDEETRGLEGLSTHGVDTEPQADSCEEDSVENAEYMDMPALVWGDSDDDGDPLGGELATMEAELGVQAVDIHLASGENPPKGEPTVTIGGAEPDIGDVEPHYKEALWNLLEEYADQFAATDLELGRTHVVELALDTGNHPPIKQRAYREAWSQRDALKQQLDAMLDAGVIEPSSSPWATPVVLVPKQDGSLRFCCDYRKLNNITVKNATPLPLIQDVLESLDGAKYYSNIDLRSGYWQIPLREEDKAKTAFTTYWGLFEFVVMPFGLTTAPGVFSQMMQTVLGDAQRSHCLCFLDDVVVHSKTADEHITHLRDVFQRLKEAGLKMKMSKCAFMRREIAFLGHRVSDKGVSVDPAKVEAMQSVPAPRTVREIRAFLGMAGYYRRFVSQFATIALPLTELTKKDVAFKWTNDCQQAFDELKKKLTTAPVLAYPSMQRPFVVYTDASGVGIGAVLAQPDEDGEEKVVSYLSQKLTPTQQRWTVSERECWSIIATLMKFRHYLLGRHFVLYTDHKPLRSMFVAEMKNARLLRWATTLGEFDVDIRYQKGREMRADYLSRLPECHAIVESAPEEDLEYLPDLGPLRTKTEELLVVDSDQPGWKDPPKGPPQPEETSEAQEGLWDRVPQNFLALQKLDPKLKAVIQGIEDGEDQTEYVISEGRLYHLAGPVRRDLDEHLQLVLPRQMIAMALTAFHGRWGHQGVDRTYALLRRRYYWEGMYRAVVTHVERCKVCTWPEPHVPTKRSRPDDDEDLSPDGDEGLPLKRRKTEQTPEIALPQGEKRKAEEPYTEEPTGKRPRAAEAPKAEPGATSAETPDTGVNDSVKRE